MHMHPTDVDALCNHCYTEGSGNSHAAVYLAGADSLSGKDTHL